MLTKEKIQAYVVNILSYLHKKNQENPKEVKYLEMLASTYYEAGINDSAVEYCEKALSIEPNSQEMTDLKKKIASI